MVKLLLASLLLTLGACTAVSQPTTPVHPTGPTQPMLGGVNGTPLDVTLTVNGIDVGPLPRVAGALPLKESLPAFPWSVQAHAPSGRVILTFDVPEDYVNGTFVAVDLSCGRVMVWVGSDPLFGPAPPSGAVGGPGDCVP